VAEMFRQRFRREARQGTYVLHFAYSGEEALGKLAAGIEPQPIVILSDINMSSVTACSQRLAPGGLSPERKVVLHRGQMFPLEIIVADA
jgi:CheY-like chemotaxis protein